jgi:hypothetical protein
LIVDFQAETYALLPARPFIVPTIFLFLPTKPASRQEVFQNFVWEKWFLRLPMGQPADTVASGIFSFHNFRGFFGFAVKNRVSCTVNRAS